MIICDEIGEERDRIQSALAQKMADLPAVFSSATKQVKMGDKSINKTNAFKEWKKDLIQRIFGDDNDELSSLMTQQPQESEIIASVDKGDGYQSDFKAKIMAMTESYNEIIGDIKNQADVSYDKFEKKRQKA